jgi:hypothetical protein
VKRRIEKSNNSSNTAVETVSQQPAIKKPKTEAAPTNQAQTKEDTKQVEGNEKDNIEGTLSLLCDYGSDEDGD